MTFRPYKMRAMYLFMIATTLMQCGEDLAKIAAPEDLPTFKVIISAQSGSDWDEIWSYESFSADTMSLPFSNSARGQAHNTQPDASMGFVASYSGALLVVAEGQVDIDGDVVEWREVITLSFGSTVSRTWLLYPMNV